MATPTIEPDVHVTHHGDGDVTWAVTDGLAATGVGAEVVVFGLPQAAATKVLERAAAALASGRLPLRVDAAFGGLLPSATKLVWAQPQWARRWADQPRLLQLLWADPAGRFVREGAPDPTLARLQPRLDHASPWPLPRIHHDDAVHATAAFVATDDGPQWDGRYDLVSIRLLPLDEYEPLGNGLVLAEVTSVPTTSTLVGFADTVAVTDASGLAGPLVREVVAPAGWHAARFRLPGRPRPGALDECARRLAAAVADVDGHLSVRGTVVAVGVPDEALGPYVTQVAGDVGLVPVP